MLLSWAASSFRDREKEPSRKRAPHPVDAGGIADLTVSLCSLPPFFSDSVSDVFPRLGPDSRLWWYKWTARPRGVGWMRAGRGGRIYTRVYRTRFFALYRAGGWCGQVCMCRGDDDLNHLTSTDAGLYGTSSVDGITDAE